MKKLLLFFASILPILAVQAQTDHSLFTTDTIPVREAAENFGEYRTFCDEIAAVSYHENVQGKPTMIQLSDENPGIAIVIWEGDAAKFDNLPREYFKKGDQVCVTGQITDYGGSPRLEVGNPRQIHKVE